jgi:hypothetical protein
MSFNLNYATKGIDFSGLGQGIAQGLMMSAQNKRIREEQARRDVEQFRENYNVKNIQTKDIGEFTTAFEDYKQTALQFSRLNKGRAKSIELAAATKAKELALNKMNTIYSQSAKVNQYAKSLADYSEMLGNNKYRVPQQISDKMSYILKTPSNQIKDEDFVDPREINIEPNANDLRASQMMFKSIDKGIDTDVDEVIKQNVPGIGDVEIKAKTKYKIGNPETVINTAKLGLQSIDTMDNTFKDQVDLLKKGLSITQTDIIEDESLAPFRTQAEAKLKDLQNKLGDDTFNPLEVDEEDLKAVLYADSFGGFDKIRQGSFYDKTAFEAALKLKGLKNTDKKYAEAVRQFEQRNTNTQTGLDLREQGLGLQREKFNFYKLKAKKDKSLGAFFDGIQKNP